MLDLVAGFVTPTTVALLSVPPVFAAIMPAVLAAILLPVLTQAAPVSGAIGRLVKAEPLSAGRLPSSFVASIDVAALIVPGAMNVAGIDRVGVVVEPSLAIWFAVPRTDVTVPEPPPAPPPEVVVPPCGASALPEHLRPRFHLREVERK